MTAPHPETVSEIEDALRYSDEQMSMTDRLIAASALRLYVRLARGEESAEELRLMVRESDKEVAA